MPSSLSDSNSNNNNKKFIVAAAAALGVGGALYYFMLSRKSSPSDKHLPTKASEPAVAAPQRQQQQQHSTLTSSVEKTRAAVALALKELDEKEKELREACGAPRTANEEPPQQHASEAEAEVDQHQQPAILSAEEQAEQAENDRLALEVDAVFSIVLSDEIRRRDWNEATELCKKAKDLLPIAERFIQVDDNDEEGKEVQRDEQPATTITTTDVNKNDGNNEQGADEGETSMTPLARKFRVHEARVRLMILQEKAILQELRSIINRSKEALIDEAFENLPSDSQEKITKAADVVRQLTRVEETLGRLHVPKINLEKVLEICATIKEIAEEYASGPAVAASN